MMNKIKRYHDCLYGEADRLTIILFDNMRDFENYNGGHYEGTLQEIEHIYMTYTDQEIIIDGKGTFNEVEYYRIAYKEGSILDYQMIIPVGFITPEKQEIPVAPPAPVEPQ